ncbi:hypothetical protein MIND_00167500 [Mycena indigotica]|uniref:NmrA-like domain-containing protein n=1 Tax=Mycena indigotica TaxID=2126181 RepID=A0A8H6WF77_9AGAR|nr:uncharacterized protein MIND_00167500 [Mycena indigotica]KAF7316484.1 hypothetical protein MIND_00167500 [Mycena indigotica]
MIKHGVFPPPPLLYIRTTRRIPCYRQSTIGSMSSLKTKILFTGATGYIGGSVLERFLSRPDADNFEFTALVRDTNKAEKLRAFGVKTVVGSLSDVALIERLASDADAVLATADSDDLAAAKATLAGLKKKFVATGVPSVYIHTSGAGIILDDAKGLAASEVVYDDTDAAQIASLPETQIHRNVDLEIINADVEGYIKGYIVVPTLVYGLASGKFVDAGIQKKHTIIHPWLLSSSLGRGRVGIVGQGKNVLTNVNVDDLADLYPLLWDAIISNPQLGHGPEGHFFAENGENTLYDLAKKFGEALVALGKIENSEPTTFTQEELAGSFMGLLGGNARCRANHARSVLGWNPVKTTKDYWNGLHGEVEYLLRK